jgi:hypothetical protein
MRDLLLVLGPRSGDDRNHERGLTRQANRNLVDNKLSFVQLYLRKRFCVFVGPFQGLSAWG